MAGLPRGTWGIRRMGLCVLDSVIMCPSILGPMATLEISIRN